MQMKSYHSVRAAGALAAGLLLVGASFNAARAAEDGQEPRGMHDAHDRAAGWAQHRQQWVHARLERSANRLEIKASQQAAWQQYASARLALADGPFGRPPRDLDAAALAKLRADRAADSARKLAVLADATAKLEVVLSPEQRQTLDQLSQQGHHGWHGQGHHGWQGGHEGHGDQDGHRGAWHRDGERGDGADEAPPHDGPAA